MKLFFESLTVSFSMYSRIPMPQIKWNGKNMRYSLLFLPVVGAVVATVLYGVFFLFRYFSLSPVFFASAAMLVPVLLTGGIHVDGYCDTCDALASHSDRETRLSIMKDPHIGAFGLIYTCTLLLLQFGAWHQIFLKPGFILPALASFVLSRALAALAIIDFPKAKQSGLAATFSGFSSKRPATAVLVIVVALLALFMTVGCNWAGLAVPAAALLFFWAFYGMSKRQFEGVTGDLAGFFITICETLALVVSAVLGAVL
jgi:adenosylcobinamide-GDP ribazoletransferase